MERAFTYIELLITLTIIAVLFVPVMQLFSYSLQASNASQDLMTATSLSRWEMERIKNLNVTKEQLRKMGDAMYPPADKEPLELNEMKWRIKRQIMQGTDPLEVRVHVYPDKQDEPVVTLVTLIENMFWEEVRPVR